MEWIGSVAFDGYPEGFESTPEEIQLITAQSESEFRAAFAEVTSKRDDATLPENGWPWPWEDSLLTDFAYVFDCERGIDIFCFGRPYYGENMDEDSDNEPEKVSGYFPDMKLVQNVNYGKRSGLLFIG